MTVGENAVFILLNGVVIGSILALTALGISLVYGVLDVPNFAQGEFAAIAGFTTVALLSLGLGLLPSVVGALTVVFFLGIGVERAVFSHFYDRNDTLLLSFFASFGLTIISENLIRRLFGNFRQIPAPDLGMISVANVQIEGLRLLAGGIALFMLALLYVFTRKTYLGLSMRAIASDQRGAELLGISPRRVYVLTFGIGALISGITGILYGMLFTLAPTTGVVLTGFAFTIVVLGGVGSFLGVFLASLLVGLVDTATVVLIGSQWRLFAVYFVLFAALAVKPGGFGGVTGEKY